MITAVATGWIVAGIGGLVATVFISVLAGKAMDTGTVDELEVRRLAHLDDQARRDESGGGAA